MTTGIPVSEFSGGAAAGDANQYAAARGLVIVELRRRNPTWVRDEPILPLDVYYVAPATHRARAVPRLTS
jgi:hypothetical protein